MANIKSAEKQNRQAIKHRAANRAGMSTLRTEIKRTREAIAAGDEKAAREAVSQVHSVIDRSAKRGLIKENTANRYKARLAASAKRAAQGE